MQNRTTEDHFRITCYYNKVVAEMRSRFEGNDQKVLCALADVLFSSSPTNANIKFVSEFYDVDSELLSSEKAIFENLDADDLCAQGNSAATMVKNMYQNGVHEVLPVAYKVFRCSDHDPGNILLCWEVVQCPSPHENLSSKHNGPRTFKSIALVNIERALANKTLKDDMQRIIDNFGERHNRSSFFLKHWIPD